MPKSKELRERIIEFLLSGEKTQTEIRKYFNLSRSRTSEFLSELEDEGIIKKRKISERTIEVSLNRENNIILGILPSSEYTYLIQALEAEKIRYIIKIFNNSLEGFKELILGHIDLLASPLISGYIFYLSDRRIKPIMGIAKGGGGVIKKRSKGTLGSTPFSKMDRISRNEKDYNVVYYRSVGELRNALREDRVDAISIWEPYLYLEGGKPSFKDELCCALFSLSSTEITKRIKERYCTIVKSHEKPVDGINKISNLLNVDINVIEETLKSYEFTCEIDLKDLQNQLSAMGIGISDNLGDFLGK